MPERAVPSSKRVKMSRPNDERDKNPEYTTIVKKKIEQEDSSSESVVEISSK